MLLTALCKITRPIEPWTLWRPLHGAPGDSISVPFRRAEDWEIQLPPRRSCPRDYGQPPRARGSLATRRNRLAPQPLKAKPLRASIHYRLLFPAEAHVPQLISLRKGVLLGASTRLLLPLDFFSCFPLCEPRLPQFL